MQTIRIKAFPDAKKPAIEEDRGVLRVFVRESAERNMANAAVIRAVAKHLNVPEKSLRMIAGHRSQNKTLCVLGT